MPQAVEAGEKVQELQLELSDLYKRHSKQSEEFLQVLARSPAVLEPFAGPQPSQKCIKRWYLFLCL